ncbi:probable G-protein coupled receptor 160 [Bombina bombina]|uniref:probable G-protein coupled receptor 160 n=1 Tax=Bombina bombina TaxID=8345 RepID=UPI00235A69DD|nr:probable G-protein coupled receptor 160 [Bombina bombina]XP_053566100.1 probable G-protein coupled receptor 160 [Bombina bombina]XP_053566101.1 probable G-protein coupled receptor 160 [Bombina bombina]XP_053566102.1 probable G-protein coupled receptor 160 [Bombina bombina]XP_053566103.1 probable G-protein coupled receptor 160 [Bombina bombina]
MDDQLDSLSMAFTEDLHTAEQYSRLQPDLDMYLLDPSCILILIVSGKILMNIFIYWARQKKLSVSFMGCFCVSLALADFSLLSILSAIYYFQDFILFGIRFTNYHICLFTQIISHVYGVMHYIVFLAAALDYYLIIVKSVKPRKIFLHLFYGFSILLLWITAFVYILRSPLTKVELDKALQYQCTFYVSSQSRELSAAILFIIFLVLAFCSSEVVALVKSVKLISYTKKTVMLFLCGDEWPLHGTKRLLATLMISFLGTWAPFVVLQIILFLLCASIPGYMDMNIAWLFFINSFLLGLAYYIKYPKIQLAQDIFSIDPFISWKYCLLPFLDINHNKEEIVNEMPHMIVI